ncbi:hypothetical protein ACBJ59_16420 [Nonomuraea sp. MTCD27]|uniref:hypothetical protein n=1 Tax=Nonomuraea sp. MTCD27 TaxID=1676747 RepID=UPI0035C01F14
MRYLFPFVLARIIFKPKAANWARPFQLLSDTRARVGALFIIFLLPPDPQNPFYLINYFAQNGYISMVAGAFVTFATVISYWISTRRQVLPHEQQDGIAFTLGRSMVSLMITAILYVIWRDYGWEIMMIPFIGIIIYLWAFLFQCSMQWYCLRWVFGISNADELLGPIVSAVTVVIAFLWDVLQSPPSSFNILMVIKVSGLVTVCLLALWEFLWVLSDQRSALE